MIYGMTSIYGGNYSVQISPQPTSLDPAFPSVQSFSSQSWFVVLDTLMFYATLDPTVQYQVVYTNGAAAQSLFFTKANFLMASE